MIEVTIYDVLLHVPKGTEVQWPRDASQLGRMPLRMALVVLKECQGERLLPIWVGLPDAIAIAQPLAEFTPPCPMTHDLIVRLVEVSASRVDRVAVTKLYDNTLYATLWVHVGDRMHEVDARPSDALSLALRMRVPIFVASDLLAQHGQTLEQMLPAMVAMVQRSQELDPSKDTDIELRSFRSLMCIDVGAPLHSPSEQSSDKL